jgi:hypothetical protein
MIQEVISLWTELKRCCLFRNKWLKIESWSKEILNLTQLLLVLFRTLLTRRRCVKCCSKMIEFMSGLEVSHNLFQSSLFSKLSACNVTRRSFSQPTALKKCKNTWFHHWKIAISEVYTQPRTQSTIWQQSYGQKSSSLAKRETSSMKWWTSYATFYWHTLK